MHARIFKEKWTSKYVIKKKLIGIVCVDAGRKEEEEGEIMKIG